MFKTHGDYKDVYARGLKTAAQASLAADWLVLVCVCVWGGERLLNVVQVRERSGGVDASY